ncbi:hypothetical protein FH5_05531 [Priestia endophytica]|nr:hypothetical protein FH5_05531 [Priestia endophytica]
MPRIFIRERKIFSSYMKEHVLTKIKRALSSLNRQKIHYRSV